MKNLLKNIKYISFGLVLMFALFGYSKAFANTYTHQCSFSPGNVATEVSLIPPGPFTTTPTNFDATGILHTNNCITDHVSLAVSNNYGLDQTLIPATTQIPATGDFPAGIPAAVTFQSPSPVGTYPVEWSTGVDESDEIIIPPGQCINNFYFTGSFRWGRVHYTGPTYHAPVTVNVTLEGWMDPPPGSQSGGPRTVVFTFPSNSNHSFNNGTDCETHAGAGCEIEGTGGFDHGYVASLIPASNCTPPPSYGGGFAHCFVADTMVEMADGTLKNIQDVVLGDVLKGETGNNKVIGFHQPKLGDEKVYSFNGGRHFVTAEHPFRTTDGWKSLNPGKTAEEHLNITVTELKVGDTLVTDEGLVKLNFIHGQYRDKDTQLYNFKLDGDHTYYADGYLVHNKAQCEVNGDPNNVCPGSSRCIDSTPPPNGALAINPGAPPYTSGTCSIPCSNPEFNPQSWCAAHPGGTFCASYDFQMHNCL